MVYTARVQAEDDFLSQGLITFDVENLESFNIFKECLESSFGVSNLSNLHDYINEKTVNNARLDAFHALNSIPNWQFHWYNLCGSLIDYMLGPDILIQRKLNLSVQLPGDETSKLGLHADSFCGESSFELVSWLPLSFYGEEASMYYFDVKTSREIYEDLTEFESKGLDSIREHYWSKRRVLHIPPGKMALFSSVILHGNVPFYDGQTRVSVNCRFKSLYTPEGVSHLNERGIGTFYQMLKLSPVSRIAIEFLEKEPVF